MKKLIILIVILISKISLAQITNVNVSLNVLPPYSPYIADYVNYQNKTLITLMPNGLPSDVKEIYFKASVVGDKGISVYTKPNYKPAQGFQIQGSIPKMLSSTALQTYFEESSITVNGINIKQLTIGDGLPEGTYQICIQVFDFVTDLPLSTSAPAGCSAPIIIQHADPPLPLSPLCGSDVLATDVQNILFNWTYNPGFSPNFQYLLKIVPVLPTQNANDAINTMVTPAFFEKIIKSTSYLYGPIDPKLIKGQKYAYRIKVFDPANKTMFKNNGESEVCTFTYVGNTPIFLDGTQITSPVAHTTFTASLNSSATVKPTYINVNWKNINSAGNKITYTLKMVKLFNETTAEKDMNNNLNVILNKEINGTSYTLIGESINTIINTKPGDKNGSVNLEDGKSYALQVTAKGRDTYGQPIVFSDFGKSQIVVFKYIETKKQDPNAQNSITGTVTGKLVYRYKTEGEQPENTSFSFPSSVKTVKTGTINQIVPNDAPLPDFICNNMFKITSDAKPVANTNIKLVYDRIESNKKDPTQYQDLKSYDVENAPHQQYGSGPGSAGVVVGSGTTDQNGNFSISFISNLKFGLLKEYANSAEYGALRIAIAEPEEKFCNSDMIVFPKKGQTITIPTEVVFPSSYNLEITVVADKKIQDQAMNKGMVVPNYPVQISVIKDNYSKKISYPKEANIEMYKNLNAEILGQKAIVLDVAKTNAEGKCIIKNLLHADLYYNFLRDQKYIQALEKTLEGNFAYKTETKLLFENYGKLENVFFDAAYKLRKRNSVLKISTTKVELELEPKNPEIYLRAITKQNGNMTQGIPFAKVSIYEYATANSFLPKIINYTTDVNGYLHLKDLAITSEKQGNTYKVTGPLRSIYIAKEGYTTLKIASRQQLVYGERFPAQVEQVLEGGGNIIGWVVNEKGEPVVSNVRVKGGPFIKTAGNGGFGINNCASGSAVLVEVVPCVDNYFAESITATILSGKLTVINNNGASGFSGKIIVKEKLHRVQFKIVDEFNKPVKQSCTSVGLNLSICYPSSSSTGLTNPIAIASADNEFHVRVVAEGYVTYDDYKIIPTAKTPTIIPIKLIKGQTITGTVYDEKTKQPIANARVYSISGVNDDGEIQNETYTDKNGKYKLSGAINKGTYMQFIDAYLQLPVDVCAVKSGDNGYLRQKQSVQGLNGSGSADFNLTSLNMKSEIWGLPVEINTVDMNADMSLKISGAFVKIPGNNTFKTSSFNAKLPFKNIDVWTLKKPTLTKKVSKFDKPEYYFETKNDNILLQTNALKVVAFNKFSCEVMGSDEFYQFPLLKMTKNTSGYGVLKGFVTSELASFNVSYQYNGRFLFQEEKAKMNTGGNILEYMKNEPFEVLGAEQAVVSKEKYVLAALYGVSDFKIHNFNASMKKGSYVNAEKFSISSEIKLKIPLVGISTLPAGTVNVSQNSITWNEYSGEIIIPLEKWKITGTGLQYDLNKGGFKILQGSLQSGLPTVQLNEMLLMPNTIDLGTNTLSGKEKLSLSNITPLNMYSGSKFNLMYDAACSFDQLPHYRINIGNATNKNVAYINDIPGIGDRDKINIEMLSDYSDGEHKSVLISPTKHKFFNIISQTISGIEVGKDYFTLIGNTDLEIPGANSNVTGRFKYSKIGNNIKCTVEKLQTDIEMPGKVKFNGTSFTLLENRFTTTGDVIMYKNLPSDGIVVQGMITKTPSQTKMDIFKNEEIKMGKDGNRSMQILSGGNAVTSNTWSLVGFTAKPKGFKTGANEILMDKADEIDFIVNGAISGDPLSDKKIKIDGIETPFGDLEITFDFDKKILQGSVKLVSANIALGPVLIIDGKINMQIDSKGFILSGAISNAAITPLPILDGFKSGIALGFYSGTLPDYMKQDLLNVTLYNQLPGLEQGLKGFYVNVMKSLSKADLPQLPGPSLDDIPGMSSFIPTFDFSAGIDLRTSLNVADGTSILIGGKANANASCLYDFGCKIGLAGSAEGEVELKYANDLTGFLLFGIRADLIYCVGSKGLGIQLKMEKQASGFKFTPSLN